MTIADAADASRNRHLIHSPRLAASQSEEMAGLALVGVRATV